MNTDYDLDDPPIYELYTNTEYDWLGIKYTENQEPTGLTFDECVEELIEVYNDKTRRNI